MGKLQSCVLADTNNFFSIIIIDALRSTVIINNVEGCTPVQFSVDSEWNDTAKLVVVSENANYISNGYF